MDNVLIKDLENIVNDYKYQLELTDHQIKFKDTLNLINTITNSSQEKFRNGGGYYKVRIYFNMTKFLNLTIFDYGIYKEGELGAYMTISGRSYGRVKGDGFINRFNDKLIGFSEKLNEMVYI